MAVQKNTLHVDGEPVSVSAPASGGGATQIVVSYSGVSFTPGRRHVLYYRPREPVLEDNQIILLRDRFVVSGTNYDGFALGSPGRPDTGFMYGKPHPDLTLLEFSQFSTTVILRFLGDVRTLITNIRIVDPMSGTPTSTAPTSTTLNNDPDIGDYTEVRWTSIASNRSPRLAGSVTERQFTFTF